MTLAPAPIRYHRNRWRMPRNIGVQNPGKLFTKVPPYHTAKPLPQQLARITNDCILLKLMRNRERLDRIIV